MSYHVVLYDIRSVLLSMSSERKVKCAHFSPYIKKIATTLSKRIYIWFLAFSHNGATIPNRNFYALNIGMCNSGQMQFLLAIFKPLT